jgi:mono/diheme cytochrome c family protein
MSRSLMSRSFPVAFVFAALLFAPLAAAVAEDAPPAAGDVPKETPKTQEPAIGWSLRNVDPEQQQRMLRFSTFTNRGIPEAYLKAENDVGYTVHAIAEGGPLYWAHCQKCHGDTGLGNGDLAYALTPSPALLAYMVQQPIAVDQYLLWSISEGGKQFGTAMPAFKDTLSEEQIWQIVAYLRAGFPDLEAAPAKKGGAAKTDEPDLD